MLWYPEDDIKLQWGVCLDHMFIKLEEGGCSTWWDLGFHKLDTSKLSGSSHLPDFELPQFSMTAKKAAPRWLPGPNKQAQFT
jgi:hypothetical protein